ncbi:glycosyltransferase [uncultured Fusobacterium sp.]|uniref:glycosyltransferase n=1 Tax=uncultured Fusobacterium sp. TaxID=159267 RepID=UPI0015A62800|nr:glycosyltransferase [uncultured Fusobacterium sp.]
MENKFSVLISVYYKEIPEYLDLSLESIIDKQILKPNEVVLVKDGPLTKDLDNIIEKYIKKYPNLFKIISLEKNSGLGKALNIGLENCSYELVARMDGDDIAKSERFQEQMEIFKNNSKVDICGSWIDEFSLKNKKIEVQSVRKVPENSDEIYTKLKFSCAFNHPTVMYKKSMVIKVGSYMQTFALEDYYLWIRLALNKCQMYNIQKSLLYFRITDGTAKRRGGLKLLINDLRFQKQLLKEKFINKKEYLRNIFIYGVYRIIPWQLREVLQKKLLRGEK